MRCGRWAGAAATEIVVQFQWRVGDHGSATRPLVIYLAGVLFPKARGLAAAGPRSLFHSITSSAATSRPGGTVRPSTFAVLRLTTVSNLVAACTGKSAGLSPRRMRST